MKKGSRSVVIDNVAPRKSATPPLFCNVDLDIESVADLSALKAELGRKVIVLHGGPVTPGCFLLRLETSRQYKTPDNTICAFCSMLEGLSPKAKRAWRSARKKEFDIGYEIAQGQVASQFSLCAETLQRLSALGATLGVTFYNHPKAATLPNSTWLRKR